MWEGLASRHKAFYPWSWKILKISLINIMSLAKWFMNPANIHLMVQVILQKITTNTDSATTEMPLLKPVTGEEKYRLCKLFKLVFHHYLKIKQIIQERKNTKIQSIIHLLTLIQESHPNKLLVERNCTKAGNVENTSRLTQDLSGNREVILEETRKCKQKKCKKKVVNTFYIFHSSMYIIKSTVEKNLQMWRMW